MQWYGSLKGNTLSYCLMSSWRCESGNSWWAQFWRKFWGSGWCEDLGPVSPSVCGVFLPTSVPHTERSLNLHFDNSKQRVLWKKFYGHMLCGSHDLKYLYICFIHQYLLNWMISFFCLSHGDRKNVVLNLRLT